MAGQHPAQGRLGGRKRLAVKSSAAAAATPAAAAAVRQQGAADPPAAHSVNAWPLDACSVVTLRCCRACVPAGAGRHRCQVTLIQQLPRLVPPPHAASRRRCRHARTAPHGQPCARVACRRTAHGTSCQACTVAHLTTAELLPLRLRCDTCIQSAQARCSVMTTFTSPAAGWWSWRPQTTYSRSTCSRCGALAAWHCWLPALLAGVMAWHQQPAHAAQVRVQCLVCVSLRPCLPML